MVLVILRVGGAGHDAVQWADDDEESGKESRGKVFVEDLCACQAGKSRNGHGA